MFSFICWLLATPALAADLNLALFYGPNPPVDELKAFDIVVVSPESGLSPTAYRDGRSELFAYLSLGEVSPSAPYLAQLEPGWLIGSNRAWDSRILDPANPSWRRFFIDRIVAPLWAQGYRGFFLDTLDSYRLAVTAEHYPRMEEGLVATIRELKQRFPEARLVLNRGFELLDRLPGEVLAVAAESLFCGYSPAKGYFQVAEADRQWLLDQLQRARGLGLPVLAIDYLPPGERRQARQVAEKIRALGITPWVTDKDLASLGVGDLEVVPRKILGLYDGRGGGPAAANIQRFAAMPLNYLGYSLELHDLQAPLPEMILEGRYAGVVVWPLDQHSGGPRLRSWLEKRLAEGVKVTFLDTFGLPPAELPKAMGLQLTPGQAHVSPLRVVEQAALVGFEVPPLPQLDLFLPLRSLRGRPLLRIANGEGTLFDAAAITSWGGYALAPFAVLTALGDRAAWVIDPFEFFKQALQLPEVPVPDVTSENGTRLLLVQVDRDGFDAGAAWPNGGGAAEELRRRILEKYPLATTVAAPAEGSGLSAEWQREAGKIFHLPWVRAAGSEPGSALIDGETRITRSHPSLTAVAPLGGWSQGRFQVFAPNQIESAYARPGIEGGGYQRVLESFRLTDAPRRLNPVHIHYRFDSVTRQGSLAALEQVYVWAHGAGLNSLFIADYRKKVEDFNRTVVARKAGGWLIRNQGALRQLRLPVALGPPNLAASRNLAGFNRHLGELYLHLGPGGEAEIHLGPGAEQLPRLLAVNGSLTFLRREGGRMAFGLSGESAMRLAMAEPDRCRLVVGDRTLAPSAVSQEAAIYDLARGDHALSSLCQ